ncbi:MAG: reverse transcriptase domain-containing protein, partial [Myxococcota bacterium]
DARGLTEGAKAKVLREALRAVNLIREKHNSDIKGRTCANGKKQREMYDKSEITSPTLSTEGLMLAMMQASREGRHIASAGVAGADLKTSMPDYVVMRFEGDMVDIILAADPSLGVGLIHDKNGKRILLVVLNKALYGCVKSAMLWYNLFVLTLKDMGFVLNEADLCVANAMIEGKQCTIAWYVDNSMISHNKKSVVEMVINKIEAKFGKMTVTHGRKHRFLGMDIFFLRN